MLRPHQTHVAEKPKHGGLLDKEVSRRDFLRGAGRVALGAGAAVVATKMGIGIADRFREETPPVTLEQRKAEFEKLSDAELAQLILNSTGNEATAERPVRTPDDTDAYKDLKNMAEGKPAYRETLLTLDGEKIRMDVEVNRDILLFRALLAEALKDPANHVDGKPILIQSGQLTNRSGSHKGRADKSHYYGNSIDFGGAMIDGTKSDNDPHNLYPYNGSINRKLGAVADAVGALVGVDTSQKAASLERVDSLHGEPGLSKGHYHFNVSGASAKEHAWMARNTLMDQAGMYFETDAPVLDLATAAASNEGREFIHTYESFRSTTYGDAGKGKGRLTIGYGATYYLKGTVITRNGKEVTIKHDGKKPRMGDVITKDEADQLSINMIKQEYTKPVVKALEKYGMMVTQPQMDALVSYSYHMGGSNAVKLVKRLRKLADAEHSNDALAINAAFMYGINTKVRAGARDGVTDRYLDTAALYIHGDYTRQNHPTDSQAWDTIIAAYFG